MSSVVRFLQEQPSPKGAEDSRLDPHEVLMAELVAEGVRESLSKNLISCGVGESLNVDFCVCVGDGSSNLWTGRQLSGS